MPEEQDFGFVRIGLRKRREEMGITPHFPLSSGSQYDLVAVCGKVSYEPSWVHLTYRDPIAGEQGGLKMLTLPAAVIDFVFQEKEGVA